MTFSITRSKGFHITFANGWTVSVQFGPGSYSDHYDAHYTSDIICGKLGSATAEIACFKSFEKPWQTPDLADGPDDTTDVVGYQSADQLAAIIAIVAARP